MIKRILKCIYMHIFHPFLYVKAAHIGKNCFIGKHARIKNAKYLYMGNGCRIGNDFRLSCYDSFCGKDHRPVFRLEDEVYIGDHFSVLCADEVVIERNVLMASYIMIASENHGMNPEAELYYGRQVLETAPVRICEGAWIGEKVVILPGVTIGKKSVVAAGAIVTKDIPEYTIAAGNPARVIKKYNFTTKKWEKVSHE